jgi:CheY-like chemotaxis protein
MPDLDGAQTIEVIRRTSVNAKQSVIIGMTSKITDMLLEQYKKAGANDVFEKPLGQAELVVILKKWFPQVPVELELQNNNANIGNLKNELIQSIIETIDDIDYQAGLRYAIQDPSLYIRTLEVSLNDLQSCNKIIVNSQKNNSLEELGFGVHKLSNVYTNIGAKFLSEETKQYENAILLQDYHQTGNYYYTIRNHLEVFLDKLQNAVSKYHGAVLLQEAERKPVRFPMSYDEYEQSLQKAIYYIRRYEYDFIVREMRCLILRGFPDDRPELEQAVKDIMNYDYENALTRLERIKNKTGDLPVPQN